MVQEKLKIDHKVFTLLYMCSIESGRQLSLKLLNYVVFSQYPLTSACKSSISFLLHALSSWTVSIEDSYSPCLGFYCLSLRQSIASLEAILAALYDVKRIAKFRKEIVSGRRNE